MSARPDEPAAEPTLPAPFDRRVQLFTGKGGVGKTSVVLGVALEAARRGHRPLIVELGHRASVCSLLEVDDVGYTPREIHPGVFAMNMTLDEALEDYITDQIRVRRVARAATQNQSLRRFFHAAPAVSEVVTLHTLSKLAEGKKKGVPPFHPILVDLDATGHALMFLELPRVFEGLAESGPLRTLLDGFSKLLRDARTTVLHLVTLPLELPAQETMELYEALRERPEGGAASPESDDSPARKRVELGALVVNAMPPFPLSADELGSLDALVAASPQLAADVQLARVAQARAVSAAAQVERLRAQVGMPMSVLPRVDGVLDAAALRALGAQLLGALGTLGISGTTPGGDAA